MTVDIVKEYFSHKCGEKANINIGLGCTHLLVVRECEIYLRNLYENESNKEIMRKDGDKLSEMEKSISLVLDCLWEQLNIGHWKSVPLELRTEYAHVASLKICLVSLETWTVKKVLEMIRSCDQALLMGDAVYRKFLTKTATIFHSFLSENDPSSVKSNDVYNETKFDGDGVMRDLPAKVRKTCVSTPGHYSCDNVKTIAIEKAPSLETFLKYMKSEEPVLISHAMTHWPASQKWNLDYILQVCRFRTVPVEIGSQYTSHDWTQKLMTIGEFVHKYMNSNVQVSNVGYLAQHNLFTQIPELMEDICTPEYCFLGENCKGDSTDNGGSDSIDINAWFGPANTVSPTHYDPKHNILTQVFGEKFVRLFPPSQSSVLNPHPQDSLLFNTSQLNIEDPKIYEDFPGLQTATYYDIRLERGTMLYIPPKWWHFVKSLSPSFSVSFWF